MATASAIAAIAALTGCDLRAKYLGAGPFQGQVIDADSGKPVPGAFVGFQWGGSGWVEGQYPHVLDVLVAGDAAGNYLVPSQRDNLPVAGLQGIHWSGEAWAPGYVLARFNETDQPREDTKHGPLKILLRRAGSATDALDATHRMNPTVYRGSSTKPSALDDDVHRELALALYRDSYHRVCVEVLPAQATARQYVETPHIDASRLYTALSTEQNKPDTNDAWSALYRQAGWFDASGPVEHPPSLDSSLLPELCRLSHVAAALPGNPA